MRYFGASVVENQPLGGGYFRLALSGCHALAESRPGQFVMVRGDWERDPLLPRAFSLLSVGPDGNAAILAKTVGRGTALLERARPGTPLSVLGPLGTSFPDPSPDFVDLLVGGGVGIPPMYMQAQWAWRLGLGRHSEILYGGRGQNDLVLLSEMKAFDVGLFLTTDDGTVGRHGLVTSELEARLDHYGASADDPGNPPARSGGFSPAVEAQAHGEVARDNGARGSARIEVATRTLPLRNRIRILACGPNPMLWAVARLARDRKVRCFISVEEQMACGIGVCLGCAVPAHSRPFRYVCKDGPVFDAADVLDVDSSSPSAPAECPS